MDGDTALLQMNDQAPWPGPAPYDASRQRVFHGRDAERRELLGLMHASPYAALVGEAGIGKTSLLLAGVYPDLRPTHGLAVHLHLDFTEGAPHPIEQQAMARLLDAAAQADARVDPPDPGESLWMYLQRRDRPMWTADDDPITPVLVFDQFEALFAPGGPAHHVDAVLGAMADLIAHRLPTRLADDVAAVRRLNLPSQQYRVVLSLRSGALGHLVDWEHRANLPRRESLHLKALSRERAVLALASAGAAVLSADAPQAIVDLLVASPQPQTEDACDVEPALLSEFCQQLNRRRAPGQLIDAALVRSVGDDILKEAYEQGLAGLPARVTVLVEAHLVQGDRGRAGYPLDEALASGAVTRDEIATLVERRLLRIDAGSDMPGLMLFHERLVPVVMAARDARQERERACQETQAHVQLESTLRERERLAAAERACRRAIAWRNLWAAAVVVLGVALVAPAPWPRQAERQAAVASVEGSRADGAAVDRSQGAVAALGNDPDAAASNGPAVASADLAAVVPEPKVEPIATTAESKPVDADHFPAPPADAAVFTSWRLRSKGCAEGPVAVTGTMRFWSHDGTFYAAFTAPPEANGGWNVEINARAPVPARPADRLELSTAGLWTSGTRVFLTEGTDVVTLSGGRVIGAQMQSMRTLCGA